MTACLCTQASRFLYFCSLCHDGDKPRTLDISTTDWGQHMQTAPATVQVPLLMATETHGDRHSMPCPTRVQCQSIRFSTAAAPCGGASGAAALVGVALCCPSAPAPSSAEALRLRGWRDVCSFLIFFAETGQNISIESGHQIIKTTSLSECKDTIPA